MKCGFINYIQNIIFGSTAAKFFLSDLLCPLDWKLHYLPISTRNIGCSTNGNADLQKWVLLLPAPTLEGREHSWAGHRRSLLQGIPAGCCSRAGMFQLHCLS